MIQDFDEEICKAWDEGELKPEVMINIMIGKIQELIKEVNELKGESS